MKMQGDAGILISLELALPAVPVVVKIRNFWYTSKSCKVQKSGPWDL